jgi:2-dehydro-3-deoxygluconokinase
MTLSATQGAIVTLGEALVSLESPQGGPLEDAHAWEVHVVGAELNYAVDLQRLGVPTAFFGAVGADPLGRRILRAARAEGVDVSGVVVDRQRPTGLLLKGPPGPTGERPVYYLRRGSAGSAFAGGQDLVDKVAVARGIHVTGVSLVVSPSLREACWKALEAGQHLPWRSFDLNVRLRLAPPAQWATLLWQVLPLVTTLFATEEELEAVGLSAAQVAEEAGRRGVTCVFRRSGLPTRVHVPQQPLEEVQAVRASRPVDPIGAGDAFAAAVTAWRLKGRPWHEAVRAGHWAGARVACVRGDYEGAPYLEDLEALVAGDAIDR